jgi:class 3 adenylate cyclase
MYDNRGVGLSDPVPYDAVPTMDEQVDDVRALGIEIRAGVHTGEMERGSGGEVRGIAVHIGARVAALAGPSQVYISRTIRDLIAGATIRFQSSGFTR